MTNVLIYDLICAFVNTSAETRQPKLLKAVSKILESIQKNKELRHKKSLQLINLLSAFFKNTKLSLENLSELLKNAFENLKTSGNTEFNEENTKKEKNTSEILKEWLSFWLKQLGAKNEETKNNAMLFQKNLLDRLVYEEKKESEEPKKQENLENIIVFSIYWLKFMKNRPSHTLRGKKMVLTNYMLNKMYNNSSAWNEYFTYLKSKVKTSETISSVNFYLNEIEA